MATPSMIQTKKKGFIKNTYFKYNFFFLLI